MALIEAAAAAKPAGGAALDQVIIATAGATIVTALLVWLILGHRNGRTPFLTRAAAFAERVSGLPPWAALPSGLAAASLNVALLGMYWDISLHIDIGRDEGPLANPAHYLILAGLYGIFAAGLLAVTLPKEQPGPAAVRITKDWYAPVGGVLMAAAGGFALTGFPLDDMWHRLFGQDVTLWGPTHLMLIGGAGLSLIGMAILLAEGMGARKRAGRAPSGTKMIAYRRVGLMGGLLIGLSTFQGEFDFGVPQFRFVFEPMLIALAAALALVAARLWIGRGGAIGAALFFLLLRGIVSLLTGPVLGETTPSMALYLPEAILVELAAAAVLARRGPLTFGAVAGVLIGTLGFAAEWAWSHVAMPLAWNDALLPEGLVMAVVCGVAGGLIGALLGTGLGFSLPRPAVARTVAIGSLAAVALCVANGLATSGPEGTAAISLDDQGRAVVRVDPKDAAEGAAWFTATSWQGGGLRVDDLQRIGDGVYRSPQPVPVSGDWKTLVRLHEGRSLMSAGVWLPEDPAIPVPQIKGTDGKARPFVADHEQMQRERKDDAPAWLWAAAALVVLAIALSFLIALAWGVNRVARAEGAGTPPSDGARFRRTAPATSATTPTGAAT
ncbi:MAG: hypothetical protein HZB46_18885 [Solirubrobacterales bacterium]|nr:hypothetical protein [Solirubrobacterales bacterium]